jgi:hypothetical protein
VTLIEEYWVGVLQRLEAEVHIFARLLTHEGERGRENELALARVLEAFVPQRYGVGTGILIDREDHHSRQTDIVLFERSDEPAVLAQTTQLLYPVESVLACIEVKTTLRGRDLDDCFRKTADLRALSPSRAREDGTSHPLSLVLAYEAGAERGGGLASLAQKFTDADETERPDLVCVIRQGLLMGGPRTLSDGNDLDVGVVLLRGDDGAPITGTPSGPSMQVLHEGRQYPLVRRGQDYVMVEPARALLLFVEVLVRRLALQQGRGVPVVCDYVDERLRERAPIEDVT